MIRTLHGRLMLAQIIGFATLLSLGGWLVHRSMAKTLLGEFDDGVNRQAQALVSFIKIENDHLELEIPARFLRDYEGSDASGVFQVWDASGRSLTRSPSLAKGDLPRKSGSEDQPVRWHRELANDHDFRGVSLLVTVARDEGERGPPIQAVASLGMDVERVEHTLARMDWILLQTGAAVLGVSVLLVGWLLRRGLMPLKILAAQAADVGVHSLSIRFDASQVVDELAPIYTRLNELLARLQEGFERERRFGSDLAHEMRTPVAELRMLAEVAIRWPDKAGATLPSDALAIALRMEGLVTRLLMLARSEQPNFALQNEPIDLTELVRAVVDDCLGRARERGLTLDCQLSEDCTVAADDVLLRAVLANLLGNAVAHAPANAGVRVTLLVTEKEFSLEIANLAPGMQPDDVSRLFERFWRMDRSRTGADHAGLGLSIAQSFARLQGFDLGAKLCPESGELVFTLRGRTMITG